MTQTSRPWQSTSPGDAGPYSAQNWNLLYQAIIGLGASRSNLGILLGTGVQPNEPLRVQAQGTPSTSIDVLAGSAMVKGIAYMSDATVSFAIAANASGNPRIDTVILRADYALQTVRLAVLQGTPAASPAVPSLTQSAGILWEIPLADIAVANGFTSITNANITRRYEYANAIDGLYLDSVLNNSGGTLEDGDVVIWDASADRAVTVGTTFDDPLLAGVWRGRTANGSYGRVQVRGIGYVNASAAVTRGNTLVTSGTTKRAVSQSTISLGAVLGLALETTSGSGYVLAEIKVHKTYLTKGYQAYVFAPGAGNDQVAAGSATLAAISGTIIIPFFLTGHISLQQVVLWNNDAANPRTWGWDLYRDNYNTVNAIDRVATSNGNETFTPGAASKRTLAVTGAPVYLSPGAYILAIQNRHATNTFALGVTAAASSIGDTFKTKTTGGVNGATLDIVTGWGTGAGIPKVALYGSIAADASPF